MPAPAPAAMASIGRVVAPLDHAGRGQRVDQADEGDRRDVERLRELALLRAFATLQARQDGPLGAGRIQFAGAMVRIRAQQSRRVIEGEGDIPPAGKGSI